MSLNAVDRANGEGGEDRVDGVAQPTPRELTVRDERAGIGQPGIGEHVESFEEATLGMDIEVGGASSSGRAIASCLCLGDALSAVGRTSPPRVFVDVAHDRDQELRG